MKLGRSGAVALAGFALLAAGGAGAYVVYGWPAFFNGGHSRHAVEAPNSGGVREAREAGPAASSQSQRRDRKVLYYRNPMGLPDVSPVPKKDSMGMDYIPVYEDEEGAGAGVSISLDKVQRSGVRTERAEKRALVRSVRAPGIAKYDERSLHAVALRADAFIEKLYVEETGASVKPGQPLFRIYSPAMVTAQVDYRVALADEAKRQASLAGAEQKLRNLEIPAAVLDEMRRTGEPVMSIDWPAPAGGVVMMKNAVEGQMMRMGEEVFRIADLSRIWVVADVAEQDIGLVAIGQTAKVHFKAYPLQTFEGPVTFLLHELDAATRTAKVRIELDNADHRIKHEMYAEVEIAAAAGSEPRLAVPNASVIDSGERQVVIVARGEGRFEPRPVKIGIRAGGYAEVLQGVAEGEEVVVGANFLIDAESNLKAALERFTLDAGATSSVPVAAEGTQ
jgi:Cu(I)/Ag(I) efflux system membrane fusion protein